jgi:hypothetical protein
LKELQKTAAGVLAAAAIATSVISNPLPADATAISPYLSSTQTVAAKVVREGVYGEFEYDLPEQKYDDARSTYKAAKETKSNKGRNIDGRRAWRRCDLLLICVLNTDAPFRAPRTGKYTAILAILIVGSFVVPMAQYFWYVRDDDTTDRFFSKPEYKEPEPPKKKGWFN